MTVIGFDFFNFDDEIFEKHLDTIIATNIGDSV